MAALLASLGIALLLLLSMGPRRAAAAGDPCRSRIELALGFLRGLPLVTAQIDGAAATLILDTGAEETMLTAAAAARLGLRPHYEYPRHLHSVSGAVVTGEARLKSLAVGNAAAADFIILVGALALPHVAGVQPAGLLGGDFLSRFDVALDLANGRLALYRPGCALLRPPWRGAYTSLPANRSIDNRLFFPVDLDGRKLFAFIDTGAQISAIDRAAVRDLGISRTAIARDPVAMMRGIAPPRVRAYAHRFAWLRVGGDMWRDPTMIVADLNLPDADIVLGLDFLRGRRVWFSYAARRLLIGPPDGPQARPDRAGRRSSFSTVRAAGSPASGGNAVRSRP
jgi:predicted aspartyl protease